MSPKNLRKFLVLIPLLLFPQSSHAFYNPSTGRWLNRDPLGEEGFTAAAHSSRVVRAEASVKPPSQYDFVANVPVRNFDFLGLSCKDPCKWARNHAGTENGVTVCCGGKKYACLVFSGGSSGTTTDPTARRVIDACVLAHEQVHVNDPNYLCPRQCLWKHPTYGDWANPDPVTHRAGECAAYRESKACLETGRNQCGANPACQAQVDAEIKHAQEGIRVYCN